VIIETDKHIKLIKIKEKKKLLCKPAHIKNIIKKYFFICKNKSNLYKMQKNIFMNHINLLKT
jgi:hypothetical protein